MVLSLSGTFIDRLHFLGIYNAFANQKLPSNKQIDIALNSAIDSQMLKNPNKGLSEEGRMLVQDLRNVMEQAKLLLLTKNNKEYLQNFIYETTEINPSADTPNAPVSQNQAQRDAQKTLDGLKTLGLLVITNGQFRKLFSDAGLLLRDMAGDAAGKAADKV